MGNNRFNLEIAWHQKKETHFNELNEDTETLVCQDLGIECPLYYFKVERMCGGIVAGARLEVGSLRFESR